MDLKRAFTDIDVGTPEPVVHTAEIVRADVEVITGEHGDADVDRVLNFLEQCKQAEVVGLDYETKRKRPYGDDAKILTIGLSNETKSMAFALDHRQAGWTERQRVRVSDGFANFLYKSPDTRKVAHHLAYELEWTAYKYGDEVINQNRWGDTISQAFILDERQGALSLEFLCWQHFGINIKTLTPAFNKDDMDGEELSDVLPYNAIDAKYARLLYHAQKRELQDEKLVEVYAHHMRRVQATVATQLKGVPVDQQRVIEFYTQYRGELDVIEADIAALPAVKKYNVGHKVFRPSAPEDFKAILKADGIHLDNTKEPELERYAGHPVIDLVLKWRGVNKLLSTYIKPLLSMENAERLAVPEFTVKDTVIHDDGLMHPIISTVKTRTWRTSAEEPNEQNFPKHENRQVRRMVKSRNAQRKVVSFDYAGIQARNIAMESRDEALIKAFWDRYDIHTDWMERIERRVPGWMVLSEGHDKKYWRNRAKNGFVFPSFFGAQPKKTSGELGIDIGDSERLQDDLWEMFPDVHGWQKRLKNDYYKRGYVTGLSGFRRRAPVSPNELINAPIQADEAIIVLTAMAELAEMGDPRFVANMEIHDDLTFFWHVDEIERNAETVIDTMLNTPYDWAHIVPIGVEMSVGDDWESVKGVGEYFSDQWNGRLQKKKEAA
jgi:DNA polymerase-1